MRIARDRTGALLLGHGPDTGDWVRASTLGLPASDLAGLTQPTSPIKDLSDRVAAHLSATGPDARNPDLASPLGRPGKILAIGLNYRGHAAELGKPLPEKPMVFAKHASAVTGPQDPIVVDRAMTAELDYEVELAVVIGVPARNVTPGRALEHVLGYCVANDVSARDLQRSCAQLSLSKGMDTFCPSGPWVTTADEVGDPHDLRLRTLVDGEVRQDSTTADLVHDVPALLTYLSSFMTLETGDVVLTGTPSGVGSGLTPPTYLKEGSVVTCEIERLGRLENPVTRCGSTGVAT